MIKRSSSRMAELVNNIMDFATTRLCEDILLDIQNIMLQPLIEQVVAELKLIHPKREIITLLEITGPVNCDPSRISQLLSNLIANALTHGASDMLVYIRAFGNSESFDISVSNNGEPIPPELHEHLFAPFTRETRRPVSMG